MSLGFSGEVGGGDSWGMSDRSRKLLLSVVLLGVVVVGGWFLFAKMADPFRKVAALDVAALLWALGFALYLWVYTPWLLRTRLDGKDG